MSSASAAAIPKQAAEIKAQTEFRYHDTGI
jgi:hypothetical protein